MTLTTSIPRSHTALVLNDMINSNLRSSAERSKVIDESGLIPNAVRCVASARSAGVPVFWIRVERRSDQADDYDTVTDVRLGTKRPAPAVKGTFAAANVDELPVEAADQVILKPRYDPFIYTDLDHQLRVRRVTHVLLGGYSTNMGVESCARTARDLGYNVVVLSDCCYNVEHDLHVWTLKHILPRFARVMTSEVAWSLLS